MRVTELQTHLLTALWEGDATFPRMLHSTAVVRVVTDAGTDGLGEANCGCFGSEGIPALVGYFKSVLLGENLRRLDTGRRLLNRADNRLCD